MIHVFINPKFTVNVLFLIYPNTIIYIYIYIHNTYLFIFRVYFKHLFTFVLCSNFEILITCFFLYILSFHSMLLMVWLQGVFHLLSVSSSDTKDFPLQSLCQDEVYFFSWFWIRSLPPFVLPTVIFDVLASRANSKHWRETCEWVLLSSSYNVI